jgi:hypothetical protein
VVSVRKDFMALLYTIMLAVVMLMSRRLAARVWWIYLMILAVLLPVQFLIVLGLPPLPSLCDSKKDSKVKVQVKTTLVISKERIVGSRH